MCSSTNALTDEQIAAGVEALGGGCCDPADAVETFRADPAAALQQVASNPELFASPNAVRLGFATGVPNGRAGDLEAEAASAAGTRLAVTDVSAPRPGGCCG